MYLSGYSQQRYIHSGARIAARPVKVDLSRGKDESVNSHTDLGGQFKELKWGSRLPLGTVDRVRFNDATALMHDSIIRIAEGLRSAHCLPIQDDKSPSLPRIESETVKQVIMWREINVNM